MFEKNDFVIHPNKRDWGVGIVTACQGNDDVSVYFENMVGVKVLRNSLAKLEKITDPGMARLFLENILISDSHKGVNDRQPFPIKVAKFVQQFKGGLYGPILEKCERQYKQHAHELFISLLNKNEFKQLIDSEDWVELGHRIKKTHSINLLSKFELIRFSDVMKEAQSQKDIGIGLYDFLYGEEVLQIRFMQYANVLVRYECDKWPIITLPLFLCFPNEHMFIKPTVTQEAALNRGFDIQYDSNLNWNTYNRVLLFSKDLYERLNAYDNSELHPRDMIDVQTFMWCTFTKGWSSEDIAKAEAKLNKK